MKSKWLVLSVAAVLSLAPLAATVRAQERAAPEPVAGMSAESPGDPDDRGGIADLDGIDLLLAAGVAAGPGPRGSAAGGRMSGGLREKLNLTDEQKERLADIRDRQERRAIPIQGDVRIAALDLRKLIRADKPDQRAIDAQIDRLSTLRATLHKSRVASMLEARAVMTPAQQKLMRETYGGMRGRGMRGGHGMHGEGDMRMLDAPLGQPRR